MLWIRRGYSHNISNGIKGRLKIYANLKSLTIAEAGSADNLGSLINIYSYFLSIDKINNLLAQIGDKSSPIAVRNQYLLNTLQ